MSGTVYPPASSSSSPVIGYDTFCWNLVSDEPFPLTGTFGPKYGRGTVIPTSAGTAQTVGRDNLLRLAGDQATPGTITLAGSLIFSTVAGTGVTTIGIGMVQTLASSWFEGVGLVADSTNGSVAFYTNTSPAVDLTAFSAGTQRGSTVTGLAATTWYRFSIAVAADATVTCVFNGSTVFSGAGGVDLVYTGGSALSPGVGVAALTAATGVYVGAPLVVTYS